MSPIIDRLAELRRHLNHLYELRPRVTTPEALRNNLSLSNDVLRSLQIVCQVVIDIASELSARNGLPFQTYAEAVQNLSALPEFPSALVRNLEQLPGFRNVLIHEYVTLSYALVIEALDHLGSIEEFAERFRQIEASS